MVQYVTEGKLPYSMLEGALKSYGASFAKSILERIDYEADEEPFVVNNLIKVQKKVGLNLYQFDLIRTYYLFKNCGALRKTDKVDVIKAIKNLDIKATKSILIARFKTFKSKLIKQATSGEIGVMYVTSQIEQQLNAFKKQIFLFENFE